jgi:hypothetical protein
MRLREAADRSWRSVYRTVNLVVSVSFWSFAEALLAGQFQVLEYFEPKEVNERWRKPRGSVEMDELDGGRLGAERLRGDMG